jgi:hypothetical protein
VSNPTGGFGVNVPPPGAGLPQLPGPPNLETRGDGEWQQPGIAPGQSIAGQPFKVEATDDVYLQVVLQNRMRLDEATGKTETTDQVTGSNPPIRRERPIPGTNLCQTEEYVTVQPMTRRALMVSIFYEVWRVDENLEWWYDLTNIGDSRLGMDAAAAVGGLVGSQVVEAGTAAAGVAISGETMLAAAGYAALGWGMVAASTAAGFFLVTTSVMEKLKPSRELAGSGWLPVGYFLETARPIEQSRQEFRPVGEPHPCPRVETGPTREQIQRDFEQRQREAEIQRDRSRGVEWELPEEEEQDKRTGMAPPRRALLGAGLLALLALGAVALVVSGNDDGDGDGDSRQVGAPVSTSPQEESQGDFLESVYRQFAVSSPDPNADFITSRSSAAATLRLDSTDITGAQVTEVRGASASPLLACGASGDRVVVCASNAPAPAGDLLLASMQLAEPAAGEVDDGLEFVYSLVAETNGNGADDWAAAQAFDWDLFQGTDRWWEAIATRGAAGPQWELMVTDAAQAARRGSVTSAARVIIDGDRVTFVIPTSELGSRGADAGLRTTAFVHDGTFNFAKLGADVLPGPPEPRTWGLLDSSKRSVANAPGAALATTTTGRAGGAVVSEASVREFLTTFEAAVRSGDVDTLRRDLHPSVVDVYGAAGCDATLERAVDEQFDMTVRSVAPPAPWVWEHEGGSVTIDDAVAVAVTRRDRGRTPVDTEIHLAPADGRLRWFTRCA